MSTLERTTLVGREAVVAGATMLGPSAFATITAVAGARAGNSGRWPRSRVNGDYGPLAPKAPSNEPGGFAYLALPERFSYAAFAKTGSAMEDGNAMPALLGAMAAFARPDGLVRLVRNHEHPGGQAPVNGELSAPGARYDALAGGGTTTLDIDLARRSLVRAFVSLTGTIASGAGGVVAIDGSTGWMTNEAAVAGPPTWAEEHGYNFFVPGGGDHQPPTADPFRAMGRFAHKAIIRDPVSGIFYQTEDAGPGRGSGFYRYQPATADARTGRLQMLAVKAWPRADLRHGQRLFKPLPVEWVDIADPDPGPITESGSPHATSVFAQGTASGGAVFNRLGGLWNGGKSVFFASRNGGDAKTGVVDSDGYEQGYGQIWEYRPRGDAGGQLILVFESPGGDVLDWPDQLLVTPRGAILLCDRGRRGGGGMAAATASAGPSRLIGITRTGDAFELASNRLNGTALAGPCFSPDSSTLFVNIAGDYAAGSGMTLAITGPWESGAL